MEQSENVKKGSKDESIITPARNKRRIKRSGLKLHRRKTDIFVTSSASFKEQLVQCEDILRTEGEIFIHCAGRAVNRGINLGLTLIRNSAGALSYEANTSTVELIDDLLPIDDEDDFTTQKRMNSSLHIRVYMETKDL